MTLTGFACDVLRDAPAFAGLASPKNAANRGRAGELRFEQMAFSEGVSGTGFQIVLKLNGFCFAGKRAVPGQLPRAVGRGEFMASLVVCLHTFFEILGMAYVVVISF
jgi:hypothetical protein